MKKLIHILVITFLLCSLFSSCAVKKQKSSTKETVETQQVEDFNLQGITWDSSFTTSENFKFLVGSVETSVEIIPEHGEVITLEADGSFTGKAKSITTKSRTKRTENSLDSSLAVNVSRVDTTRVVSLDLTQSSEKKAESLDKKTRPAISLFIGMAIFITIIGCVLILARKLNWL